MPIAIGEFYFAIINRASDSQHCQGWTVANFLNKLVHRLVKTVKLAGRELFEIRQHDTFITGCARNGEAGICATNITY
jgi:hypothetical protein